MPSLQSPLTTDRPKSSRKPLQPKNSLAEPEVQILKPTPKQNLIRDDDDKENHLQHRPTYATAPPPTTKLIEPMDSSLAEELTAMRKRMERLRLDAEKTQAMLNERGKSLDLQMKELEARGVAQIMLELEVDRLYRLKELHSYSMRISPLRSLRDKEQEKKPILEEDKVAEGIRSGLQTGNQSPCCSSSSSNSVSTQLTVAVAV